MNAVSPATIAERLENAAVLTPGYAAALINLAGEIREASDGQDTEHGGPEWVVAVTATLAGEA